MVPILTIIASSIRKIVQALTISYPTNDPYIDNVVLSLRMESSDPYYNQVVLGMHMDDVGLTDVKGHTPTLNGSVARSATQSKFGGYSAYFDGVGDDITFATSTDWNLAAKDFCMEAWIYFETTANSDPHIITLSDAAGTIETRIKLTPTRTVAGLIYHSSAYQVIIVGTTVIAANTWYHVAFTRYGNAHSIFVNGVKEASATVSHTVPAGTILAYIGRIRSTLDAYRFKGYIDDVRVTNGAARYTNSFSIPTAAFPEPVNTAIDDTGKTVTTVGNAQYSGVSKYGSGSFYFDGTGDYLTVPNTGDFNFGAGDFTIEMYVRLNVNNTVQGLFEGRGTTNDMVTSMVVSVSATGKLDMGASTANAGVNGTTWSIRLVGTTTLTTGVWSHIAITRSNSTWSIFLNGTQEATGTSSITVGTLAATVYMGTACNGAGTLGYYLNGYIDDLRITKGVARYTSNFTPYKILTNAPAGDPYYNYTALLLKMNGTNGGTTFTDNSYNAKTMSVFGNTNTSTAQLKYGTASGYFDGTDDYLTTPYNSGFAPSGDFTCECWIRSSNVTSLRSIVGPYTQVTNTLGWLFYQSSLGALGLVIRDSGGAAQTVSSADGLILLNVWHHVAWTRTGTTYKLFIDGAVVATAAATVTLYVHPSHPLIIGRWDDVGTNSRDWLGYIDDLRLTNGVARYTSAFTPPGPHIANTDPETDPWWLNTVLALRMDGTHGSTAITDLTGKTVSSSMTVARDISKFGQSAYSNGSTSMSIPTSTNFDFGTGNFTIEGWFYLTANSGAAEYPTLVNRSSGAGNLMQWALNFSPSAAGLVFNVMQSNGVWTDCGPSYSGGVSTGQWYHFALVRIGTAATDIKLFLNGALVASSTSNPNMEVNNVSKPITFMAGKSGYLDDVRITKGIARYTANFTPSENPIPTAAVGPDHDQYWDKVVLALPFDSNLNDARAKTVTAYGNAGVSATQKKFGTTSCYFDGAGDYLSIPYSSDFDLSNLNFTIEMWVYRTGANANSSRLIGAGGDIYHSDSLGIDANGYFTSYGTTNGTTWNAWTGAAIAYIPLNDWVHVAVVRNGGTVTAYVNGKGYVLTTTLGTAALVSGAGGTTTRTIGGQPGTDRPFSGYIDDLRYTKGVARYTADFVPPTVANIIG